MKPAIKPKRTHSFRSVKFDEQLYPQFLQMTHDRGSSIQREIAVMVKDSILKGKLPSEMAVILNETEEV